MFNARPTRVLIAKIPSSVKALDQSDSSSLTNRSNGTLKNPMFPLLPYELLALLDGLSPGCGLGGRESSGENMVASG